MSLSIIIPCRNEEKNINFVVEDIANFLDEKIYDFELIIINDFSDDNTLKNLKELAFKNKHVKYFDNKKKGLGGAINLGIKNSKKKYTIISMADFSDSPKDIWKYYNEIKAKNVDAVMGSRFIKGSKILDYPIKKLILNRIFNTIVRLLFFQRYNDFTNAFKIYRTEILKDLRPLVSENFNIFLELPLKIIIRNYKFSIIPIDWKGRKYGEEKFKIKELGSKYLFTLLYCLFEKVLLR